MSWLNQWQRSPRQDRRTVIDGKFVELAPPTPSVVVPEAEESALEIVTTEAQDGKTDERASTGTNVLPDGLVRPAAGDGEGVESGTGELAGAEESVVRTVLDPALPATEVSESEKLQEELEPLPTSLPAEVLPTASEGTAGEDVLDGAAGRVEDDKPDYPF